MGLLEPGTAVLVEGLKARPDLNGKPAVVVAFAAERERYQVKMTATEEELYLRPANVSAAAPSGNAASSGPPPEVPLAEETPASTDAAEPRPPARPPTTLEPGTGVELSGLKSRPDLNGKRGRVVSYVPDRERYHVVVLGTNEETYLRAANLEATPAAAEAVAAPAEPAPARGPPVPERTPEEEEEAAAKAAIARESIEAAALAAAAAPPPPVEEIKDDETLLKEFFSDISDASRDAEVERILSCFKLNPYEHLNLRFDATEDDIRRAFRKVSLMVHPDKCKHEKAKAAFDAIGQAQQLLGQAEVKRELDFNLGRAREAVIKAWRKETRNDVVLRVRFNGNRDAQQAAFLESDDFHERWKLEGRKNIVDLEWRRRKLTLRIKAEEERVEREEKEEFQELKRKRKGEKNWNSEAAREGRVGGWREFMGEKKKKKKHKVAGETKAPKLRKEERASEEAYHGLDKSKRVLRPDEVSKAW
jgi:DnaJ family protein C protein 8